MEWIAILCLISSALLLLLEIMVPSMGLLTILSALSLVLSYIFGFGVSATLGWTLVGFTLVIFPLTVYAGVRMLPRTPWGRRMVVAGPTFSAEEGTGVDRSREDLLGAEGVTYSKLHPCGVVSFGERQISCMTRGEMILEGVGVRVIGADGNRVLVEAIENDGADS